MLKDIIMHHDNHYREKIEIEIFYLKNSKNDK